MTAKEFLSRARGIEDEIEQIESMKQAAYDRATSCTAQLSKVPAHGVSSDVMTAYSEYAAQLDLKKAELLRIQCEIVRGIDMLPKQNHRKLLKAHYIQNVSLQDISQQSGKDYRTITRWHGRALQAFEKILGNLEMS